jgi:hypothetical protein
MRTSAPAPSFSFVTELAGTGFKLAKESSGRPGLQKTERGLPPEGEK